MITKNKELQAEIMETRQFWLELDPEYYFVSTDEMQFEMRNIWERYGDTYYFDGYADFDDLKHRIMDYFDQLMTEICKQ